MLDVLIVGAGPVGLTLANDLAARGLDFRIIDSLPEPTRNSRAHGMQSRTLEALDPLGLAEPMLAVAQRPQSPLLMLSGSHTVARLDFSHFHHEPYPYQLIIWQQRIEQTLAHALAQRGRSVDRSTRLLSFAMDGQGVTAEVEGPEGRRSAIRAAWIVGCDGGHSTVREGLGLRMEGETLPQRYWIGEFDVDWKRSRDAMYEWWHQAGMASAIYIDFTNKWHVFVECQESDEELPNLDRMQALFRTRTGDDRVRLSNPAWMHVLTFNQRMPEHFTVERAILAGDAAHVHTAAGGQGMNTGMQDALNLGWKLALTVSGTAAPGLLESYDAERVANARKVLRATLRYQRFQVPHGNVERLVSGALIKSAMKIRPLGDALAKVTGMLDINYEESPLSRQDSEHATRETRAGWHVPDAPCRIAGEPGRLFQALRGTKANLLVFAGSDPGAHTLAALKGVGQQVATLAPYLRVHSLFASESDADGGIERSNTITDGGQHVQSAFGMSDPEIVYVRPDGYIGLRTQDLGGGALMDYLRSIYALPVTPGSFAGAV